MLPALLRGRPVLAIERCIQRVGTLVFAQVIQSFARFLETSRIPRCEQVNVGYARQDVVALEMGTHDSVGADR